MKKVETVIPSPKTPALTPYPSPMIQPSLERPLAIWLDAAQNHYLKDWVDAKKINATLNSLLTSAKTTTATLLQTLQDAGKLLDYDVINNLIDFDLNCFEELLQKLYPDSKQNHQAIGAVLDVANSFLYWMNKLSKTPVTLKLDVLTDGLEALKTAPIYSQANVILTIAQMTQSGRYTEQKCAPLAKVLQIRVAELADQAAEMSIKDIGHILYSCMALRCQPDEKTQRCFITAFKDQLRMISDPSTVKKHIQQVKQYLFFSQHPDKLDLAIPVPELDPDSPHGIVFNGLKKKLDRLGIKCAAEELLDPCPSPLDIVIWYPNGDIRVHELNGSFHYEYDGQLRPKDQQRNELLQRHYGKKLQIDDHLIDSAIWHHPEKLIRKIYQKTVSEIAELKLETKIEPKTTPTVAAQAAAPTEQSSSPADPSSESESIPTSSQLQELEELKEPETLPKSLRCQCLCCRPKVQKDSQTWTLADKGKGKAQYTIALSYYDPQTEQPTDPKQFIYWLTQAHQSGYTEATITLAYFHICGTRGVTRNGKRAAALLDPLATQGHPEALFDLGNIYLFGKAGVARDIEKAKVFFKESSEKGFVSATRRQGICLLMESNDISDAKKSAKAIKKAVDYFKQAADQKDVDAIVLLATCYRDGRGVITDFDKALKLAEDAHKLDPENYMVNLFLAQHYQHGYPLDKRDLKKAITFYRKVADSTDLSTLSRMEYIMQIAHSYTGIEDWKQAIAHYEQALEIGNTETKALSLKKSSLANAKARLAMALIDRVYPEVPSSPVAKRIQRLSEEAVKLDKTNPFAHYCLGISLRNTKSPIAKDYKRIRHHLSQAMLLADRNVYNLLVGRNTFLILASCFSMDAREECVEYIKLMKSLTDKDPALMNDERAISAFVFLSKQFAEFSNNKQEIYKSKQSILIAERDYALAMLCLCWATKLSNKAILHYQLEDSLDFSEYKIVNKEESATFNWYKIVNRIESGKLSLPIEVNDLLLKDLYAFVAKYSKKESDRANAQKKLGSEAKSEVTSTAKLRLESAPKLKSGGELESEPEQSLESKMTPEPASEIKSKPAELQRLRPPKSASARSQCGLFAAVTTVAVGVSAIAVAYSSPYSKS